MPQTPNTAIADRDRYRQELVHVVGHDARGAIVVRYRGSPIYRLA